MNPMNYTDPSGNVAIALVAGAILEHVVDTAIETFVDVLIDMVLDGESFSFIKSAGGGFIVNLVPIAGEASTSKKLAKLSTKYGDDIVLALKNTDEIVKHADEIIEVASKDGVKGIQRYLSTFGKGIKGMVKADLPELVLTNKQLQKKFKHAADFGIEGNFNPQSAKLFEKAIQNTVNKADKIVKSTYHGDNVMVYMNDGVGVIQKMSGEFVSGWKFTQEQIEFHLKNGTIIK